MAISSVEHRFFAKFVVGTPDECWEWAAGRIKDGYGRFAAPHDFLAHRFAYRLAYGDIPAGVQVLHRCDNPPCVNPAHLFLGTQADNVTDMLAKGRAEGWSTARRARGLESPNGKLTDDQVRAIRVQYATGTTTQTALAAQYGVTQNSISCIIRRKTFAYLDDHQAV